MAKTSPKSKIMKIASIGKNNYLLAVSDVSWIERNLSESPKELIQGLLKRRFDNPEKIFKTDKDLAKACVEFVKSNSYEFQNNPIDKKAYGSFLKLDLNQPTQVMEAFRILWRGYEDKDVMREEKTIKQEETRLKKLVKKRLDRNNVLLKSVAKKGKEIRKSLYQENEAKLEEVKEKIEETFKNPNVLAHRKLSYSVSYRRKRKFWSLLGFLPHDYTFIESEIRRYDPDDINFPLRFLIHVPVTLYHELRKEWRKGKPRDDLIVLFDRTVRESDFFDKLLEVNDQLKVNYVKDREQVIREMKTSAEENCHLATTLLGVTQTEGILWDFATYLNRKNIRIFKKSQHLKPKYHPYEWDNKINRYKKYRLTGRPDYNNKMNLTSARQLLQRTRLGCIIDPDLYSYLIDEFYDDRNEIMHGEILNRNFKADAIAALLCFRTCMLSILDYVTQ